MRHIRHAFLGVLAVCLITVALANSAPVTLNLLPPELAGLFGIPPAAASITLPLFMALFAGIVSGLLIGFVWEYLREHRHRAEATRQRRARKRLERDLAAATSEQDDGRDDVLAILDKS